MSLRKENYARRYLLMVLAFIILTAAAWGGLLRLGWRWPVLQPTLPLSHGPLMVAGFFGTLIALERAVAINKLWAYLSPLMSGAGGLLLVFGVPGLIGPALLTFGSAWLVLIFVVILQKHRANYMIVIALGALALLVGNLLWLFGWPVSRIVLWWASFLILTIAGERLELSRMVRLSRPSLRAFSAAVIVFIAGLVILLFAWDAGVRVAGAGMIAIGLWLLRFDIARRTVKQAGLTRFIAVCLLSAYVWLLIAGILAIVFGGLAAGPFYDATLHAIFLGFTFGMIFGHAPIIFPAVLGVDINYRPIFYLPLIFLHSSLILRIGGELLGSSAGRQWGGLFNALAVIIYLLMISPLASRLGSRKKG